MRSPLKAAVPIAVAAGLVAASPAAAEKPSPKAQAAGGDAVVLNFPKLVQVRVDRTERALERATTRIENDNLTGAATTLKVVRRQLGASWRGAKYIIRTTPPPPPAEDARVRVRAKSSGAGPTGPVYAAPADTGFLALTTIHDVSAAVAQLVDGAHGTGLAPLATTLNYANDLRDKAIQDIVALAPPAPPAEDARARASGGAPVGSGFDTVMPNVVPQIGDEIQAIDGLKSDADDLTNGGRGLLNRAQAQITKTKGVVNTTWPPAPTDD